jgi:Protein of unknown function (DUF2877)
VTALAVSGLSASAELGDLLSGPPVSATVRGVTGPACYLDVGGRIVVVEGSDGVGLPNAVRIAQPARPPLQLEIDDVVVLGRRALTVDARGIQLPVQRWWDPYVRVGSTRLDAAGVAVVTAMLRSAAAGRAGGGLDSGALDSGAPASGAPASGAPASGVLGSGALADVLHAHDDAGLGAAATALLGRGPGLTPAGDDVLAGILATLRVLGPSRPAAVATRLAATADALADAVLGLAPQRTTALSAQLLEYADRGAVALPVADVLRAIAGRGGLVAAAARLARVGHTSGSDLLTGIALAVDVMLPSRKARAHV